MTADSGTGGPKAQMMFEDKKVSIHRYARKLGEGIFFNQNV